MGNGWIRLDREMFESDIWHDVTTFRLFVYLLAKASYKDGVKMSGIELKRGQYLRSYRKLAEDLAYKEGRGTKTYSLKTIKKCIEKPISAGRVNVQETEQGTLFTIVNYSKYHDFSEEESETVNTINSEVETNGKRTGNNNKNAKKDIYIAAADIYNAREESIGGVPTTESAQLSNGSVGQIPGDSSQEDYERIKNLYMQLAGKGGFDVSPKDEMAINELLQTGIDVDKALVWLKECFDNYKPKHSRDKINSFSYCVPYILDKHYAEKEGAKVAEIQQHRRSTSSLERKDSI